MKKILFLFVFISVFALSDKVFAATISTPNGDPMSVGQPWGLNGYQTPRVASGSVIKDKYGISFTCPHWFGYMGCFNIVNTEWYINYQTASAKNLLSIYGNYAYIAFPYFSGWLNSVK